MSRHSPYALVPTLRSRASGPRAGLLVLALFAILFAALALNPGAALGQSGPKVTGVAVTSTPASSDTYTLGETIRVALTFSEVVNVSGTPRLKIDMDPAHWGQKWASYESGAGTNSLTFAHEVVEPNISTRGIAVLANTLGLNGGAIRSASSGVNANLAHAELNHDPNHKVDWRLERAEEEPTPEPVQEPLQVSITASATVVPVEEAVTLSAVISNPPANFNPSYQWELDLGGWYSFGTDPTFSYLTSIPESQAFRVTVTYDSGDSATSEPLTVTWKELPDVPGNLEVAARPGELDVSVTWDATEGASSYRLSWRLADKGFQPGDRTTTIGADATFTVSEGGQWVVRLEGCNDAGCGKSAVQTAAVESVASAQQRQSSTATADAGPDQEVETGETVTLDGSGSSTTLGTTLAYTWTRTKGPPVGMNSIELAKAMPSFTAPSVRTDLEFSLVVNDGTNDSAPDTVAVAVRPPLNPTSAPCVHPKTDGSFADLPVSTISMITDHSIRFNGIASGGSTYDLWFCWLDGTPQLRATGVTSAHFETVTGLSSATTYWEAAKQTNTGQVRWDQWRAVTTTGGASIRGVAFSTLPSHDADSDGAGDTYLIWETIQAEVTWSQPVTVDAMGDDANVSLRLDLGADDTDLTNSRKKMAWTGEGSGTDTLTFEYQVQPGEMDGDGVWLQTASASDDTVVFLENGATITGGNPATNSAVLTRTGLPATGDTGRKVDGTATATANAGPDQEVEAGATVTLDGSGSSTTIENATLAYTWTQTDDGPKVTLDATSPAMPTFTAPSVRTDLEFSLVVNDGTNDSVADTVSVAVRPPLNPTSVPCAHPAPAGASFVTVSLFQVTEKTDSSISFKGNGPTNTLWFCWPDGTRETRATGVNQNQTETVSGLDSGTRYWVLGYSHTSIWNHWRAVTTTGGASIVRAEITSTPTHDADGDGTAETYLIGEAIWAEVTWSQEVTVANGSDNANVSLRLDLGADDANLSNSQEKMAWTGEGDGGDTLTFEYQVQLGDEDSDGMWLQTASASDDTVVFLENGATITGGNPASSSAVLTRSGLPTSGDANRKTVTVLPGPPLLSAVANSKTLALVYEEALDKDSVPAAADFTVKADGSKVSLRDTNPVAVGGNTVTSANVVTVSYTKGTNPIQNLAGSDAFNLVDREVGTTQLTVQRAFINRAGTTVTIELSETILKGAFNRLNWTYTVNGVNKGNPADGAFDAGQGTITLTISPAVNVEERVGGAKVAVSYRRSGTASERIGDQAGEELASFSGRQLRWYIPNAACTKGPGPDPWNPDSPCGAGPDERPENYKSIGDLTEWELNDPPEPPNVQINCPEGSTDCTISWERPEGISESFVYNIYLHVDLNYECATRSILVSRFTGRPGHDTSPVNVTLNVPDVPTGCTIDKGWVASVSVETASGKVSGSGLAFREP